MRKSARGELRHSSRRDCQLEGGSQRVIDEANVASGVMARSASSESAKIPYSDGPQVLLLS